VYNSTERSELRKGHTDRRVNELIAPYLSIFGSMENVCIVNIYWKDASQLGVDFFTPPDWKATPSSSV